MEVRFRGPLKPDRVEEAMERLERLGINATIASPVDAELMYLQKQAYITKRHTKATYKNLVAKLEGKNASKEEWVTAMRTYWNKQLKVDDVTALPGYNPQGEWQEGFLTKGTKVGQRHQMRFDISEEEMRKEMGDYVLSHSLTNGAQMVPLLEMILDNNGAMVSTVEKLRMGVPPGGMSPERDMDTGGATYFFTRIRKRAGLSSGLHFKIDMLRRMDAVSYDEDKYGETRGEQPTKHRKNGFEQWKKAATRTGANETIFKYSVTLLDNIESIKAKSKWERDDILEVFKKRGITELPDGRKIEEVVTT